MNVVPSVALDETSAHCINPSIFGSKSLPPRTRDPDADDLNRSAASRHHLALCCRKLAPDEPGQHVAFEAMNVDEQRRVDATAAAREQL